MNSLNKIKRYSLELPLKRNDKKSVGGGILIYEGLEYCSSARVYFLENDLQDTNCPIIESIQPQVILRIQCLDIECSKILSEDEIKSIFASTKKHLRLNIRINNEDVFYREIYRCERINKVNFVPLEFICADTRMIKTVRVVVNVWIVFFSG